MTDKLVQWIRDLTIRRKLLSGIAIVLALDAYLALYAINRLSAVGAVANNPAANQIVSDTAARSSCLSSSPSASASPSPSCWDA